jgi:hypothetical protein
MAITNGYASLASFKTRFGTGGTDANRDAEVESVIQGVSRLIDALCNRVFFASAIEEARYFSPTDWFTCFTDDIQSITTLKTDEDGDGTYETTWALTDYRLQPLNRVANITPATWLETKPNGQHFFPLQSGSVEITGKFGFCLLANVPDIIKEACYIQSHRVWSRKDAPFGVTGSAGMGQVMAITKLDPDVELMLEPYLRVM